MSRIDVDRGNPGEVIPISFNSFSVLNTMRKATLHQANKLLIVTRGKTQAEGVTLPPVHGAQKHLGPEVKPEHDKPVQEPNLNKQKSPVSADAKPRVLIRPKLPASQIVRKRLIDRSIKLLNKPRSQMNAPGRTPAIQRQSPVAQGEPPQPSPNEEVDNVSPPIDANQPTNNGPVPVKHFEPNPLFEVPQTDQIPQGTVSQKPVLRTEGSSANQDPFDTQVEVPFSKEIVEPVYKRPEMTDFEIPPVLEEMIPDGALIHKHLPRQADIDRIMIQIDRKYLKRMHLPCSLKDMQAAYMQSPHFCDIYNVLMFNRYPKCKRAIEK